MINRLEINNYKCFSSQTFDFRNLTLLAGMNGAGKSTVIQSLLLLRQSHEQGMLAEIGLALNGDYVKVGQARDALFEKASEDSFGFLLKFDKDEFAGWHFVYNAERDVLRSASVEGSAGFLEQALFTDCFQYLHAERTGPRTSFPTSDYLVRRKRRLGNGGEYAVHFLSFFGRRDKVHKALLHAQSSSPDLIDQVEAWMGEISPGTRMHFLPHDEMDAVSVEYSFAFGNETSEKYRATNVGFGITYILPVIIAILASKPNSLLIIENPEAHVHPKGQIIIGKLLSIVADLGVQVVVETHSDHILNGIRLALHAGLTRPDVVKLYYFNRSLHDGIQPTTVTAIEVDNTGRLKSRPEGFFDEFSRSMDALLDPETPYGGTVNS